MKFILTVLAVALLSSCAARRAHRHAHAHAHAEKHHSEDHIHHKTGHVVTVLPKRCVKRTIRGAVFYHDGHHWYRRHARGYVVVVKPE